MAVSTSTEEFDLADAGTVADLRTFVTRARIADDGAIRLQGAGPVLAAYVSVMRPKLLGEGTPNIMGLRTMALTTESRLDVTVSLASVADRLARMDENTTSLSVPPVGVNESWAAVSAPRGDWKVEAHVTADDLIAVAKDGIKEVAQIIPVNPGAMIVNNARASVWGRTIDGLPVTVPMGAAFAAFTLGFVAPGEQGTIYSSNRWLRLSTARGHVLIRPSTALF